MITHVVIFRTRFPDRIEVLKKGVESLKAIEGAEFFYCGNPLPSSRPVVDDSFAVGLVVSFKDEVAMQNYAQHPIHLKFLENEFKYAQAKVDVFDMMS